jgi:pimeloyl-ACP methyl ester carboxylesterase
MSVSIRLKIAAIWLALAGSLCVVGPAQAAPAPAQVRGVTCHLPGYTEQLRCFSVPAPLKYQQPNGEKIVLHVTVAPAFREAAKDDPLFVLAGGPGQAASDALTLLDNTFRFVRTTRDIVFIDQRGTGLSGKLDCDSTNSLEGQTRAEQEKVIGDCLVSLKKPFAAYTTDSSARDLDTVRAALQYEQINIWGVSYGTRLGQAYARRFPARLRAMVLDGVAPPEQIIFAWGRDAQASLDSVFRRCAADTGCHTAFPNAAAQFGVLLERVRSGTIKLDFPHPRTAQRVQLQLLLDGFLQTVRSALYAANAGSRLPFVLDSAYKGNWAPFLALMYAPGDYTVGGAAAGLLLAVTCAEDIPRLTPAIIADEERNSFLAGAEVKIFPALCRFVNVPPVAYMTPTPIAAPVLLLSGALDPVTPPHRAARAAPDMRHAQHFVVSNLGHGVSFFGCAPKLLRSFLEQPDAPLDAKCLSEIPPSSFQLGAAGPQP